MLNMQLKQCVSRFCFVNGLFVKQSFCICDSLFADIYGHAGGTLQLILL